MTCLKSTRLASGTVCARPTPNLAQPLTARTFVEIERTVISALEILGRELFGVGIGMAREPAVSEAEAAELEYASWMPDPGAIEVASWTPHLRSAVR
jgi:hypothetical protein